MDGLICYPQALQQCACSMPVGYNVAGVYCHHVKSIYCTNRYALQAFKEPIVLLLGGRDKGNDYSRLTELVQKQVKAIVAIGESAGKVEEAFRGTTVISKASAMDEAVSTARFLAQPGDIVLLSPACASFDWFQNYEHRGQVFKELVNKF